MMNVDDRFKFGDNIRRLRKAAGYTRESLAEKMDLSHYSIGAWERGDKQPRLQHIYEMAKLFGVDMREFFPVGL